MPLFARAIKRGRQTIWGEIIAKRKVYLQIVPNTYLNARNDTLYQFFATYDKFTEKMSFDLDPVLNFRAGKLELITLFFATPTLFFLTSKFKYK